MSATGFRRRTLDVPPHCVPPRPSRPSHLGRQRHEDRLDIAAGREAEQRAAIIKQIELDVAAAPHELVAALPIGPGFQHVASHDRRVDGEKGLADVAREGEVPRPIAAVEIVEKNAADATRLIAVLKEEIRVAPFLEALVIAGIVRVARGFERGVKIAGIDVVRHHRRQIGTAAEP